MTSVDMGLRIRVAGYANRGQLRDSMRHSRTGGPYPPWADAVGTEEGSVEVEQIRGDHLYRCPFSQHERGHRPTEVVPGLF